MLFLALVVFRDSAYNLPGSSGVRVPPTSHSTALECVQFASSTEQCTALIIKSLTVLLGIKSFMNSYHCTATLPAVSFASLLLAQINGAQQ